MEIRCDRVEMRDCIEFGGDQPTALVLESGGRHFASRQTRAPLKSIASLKRKLSLEIFALEIDPKCR